MKALIWKELRENFKWTVLPSILILGRMILFGVAMFMESSYLAYVGLVAGPVRSAAGIPPGLWGGARRQTLAALASAPDHIPDHPGYKAAAHGVFPDC
jgi:hypothetical protein